MTRIEDLVRQALDTQPATTTTTDPLAALDRRLHRARIRLAVGGGVALVAVAAAVVVPLSTVGGDRASKIGVANPSTTATPTPSPQPGLELVEQLVPDGATAVSRGDGEATWFLATGDDGAQYVSRVGRPGSPAGQYPTASHSDYVVAGAQSVWLVRSTDTGFTDLSAFDPSSPSTMVNEQFEGMTFTSTAVQGDSLYAVADKNGSLVVERFRLDQNAGHIELVSTTPLPEAGEIVATYDGHLWVHAGTQLVELVPTTDGVRVAAEVDWGTGPIFGPTGDGDAEVWSYDGRVIALTPKYLSAGTSVAEGARLTVPGRPEYVVSDHTAGLYVYVVDPDKGQDAGLYYYPSASGTDNTQAAGKLVGVQVMSLAADPDGGVDYVDDQGRLSRWDPTDTWSR